MLTSPRLSQDNIINLMVELGLIADNYLNLLLSEFNEYNTTFSLISRILKPIEIRNKLFITYTLCPKKKLVSIVAFWWTQITLLILKCSDNRHLFIYDRGSQTELIDIKIDSVGSMVELLEGIKVGILTFKSI